MLLGAIIHLCGRVTARSADRWLLTRNTGKGNWIDIYFSLQSSVTKAGDKGTRDMHVYRSEIFELNLFQLINYMKTHISINARQKILHK